MKILSISNKNLYNYKKINKIYQSTPTLKQDKISFCANLAPYNRVCEIKAEAISLQNEANEILEEAKNIENVGNKLLKESKMAKFGAIQYINFSKKMLDNGTTEFTFEDGKVLNCSLNFEDNTLYLDIALTDEDGTPLMDIEAVNFKPNNIQLYNDSDGFRNYDFIGDETIISTDVQLGENDGDIQSATNVYTFYSGKLLRLKQNVTIEDDSHNYEKHFYFMDGGLISYSEDVVEQEKTNTETHQRKFTFADGKINGYFLFWHGREDGEMEWDEGYHFKNDEFIGFSSNAKQKSILDKVCASEIIFRNSNNKFVLKQNGLFELDDYGEAIFEE